MSDESDSEAVAGLFRDSSPPSLCMQGQSYVKSGRVDVALMYFMRALNIDPDYALAWCDYGHCLHQLGRLEDAKFALVKATELAPRELLAWALLGLTHADLKDREEAERCLQVCRQLGPDDRRTEFLSRKLSQIAPRQQKSWWQFWK